MSERTVAHAGAVPASPHASPTPARTKSPQRVLQERLTRGKFRPRAWMVAMVLEAHMHADTEGRRFATVYNARIAALTGMSVQNVRRALAELTSGDAPLYERRGTSGQMRTVRGRNGWELNTRGAVYYWIDNLPAYLAARDTARAANVIAFEQRKSEQQAERVKLQAAMLTGAMDQSTHDARIAQLDAKARRRLPKRATTRAPTTRCLRPQQRAWFADVLVKGGATNYTTLLRDAGGEKRVREFHALHRHVFGHGEARGCSTCEAALFDVVRQLPVVTRALSSPRAEAVRCGCGTPVVRSATTGASLFWAWAQSELEAHAECIHEQDRLLKLRAGAHP